VLLADDLAQLVPLEGGETGQGHRHLGDLLLVDGDAVGLAEHLAEQRMQGAPGLAAHAGDELEDEGVGRRPDDRGGDHQVLEEVARLRPRVVEPHPFQQLPGGRALDVEAAHRLAAAQQLPGLFVLQGLPGGVADLDPGVLLHRRKGVADDGEGAVAEDVDLHQPGGLGLVLLPLDERQPFGGDLHRHVAADLVGDDHQPAAVQGEVTQLPVEPPGNAEDGLPVLAQLLPFEQGMPFDGGGGLVGLPVAAEAGGKGLDLSLRHAEDLGHLAQGGAPLEADLVGDHRRPSRPVAGEGEIEDGVALVPGKVDVDVGRIEASLVEEALEEEVVADRVDVGDFQAVGDQRRRGAPPAAGAR
jgi:hypothetical protein